jgi:hypothetical protein
MPPLIDTDKYEALCVQPETVSLNGVRAHDLIKYFVDITRTEWGYHLAELRQYDRQ